MTEKKPQAIAMTAPVLEKDAGERGEMMAFILPKVRPLADSLYQSHSSVQSVATAPLLSQTRAQAAR